MRDKIKKIIVVAFLTLFIWAWAFNAIEVTVTEPLILSISTSANPDLLVTFSEYESPVNMSITLKGPASKIKSLKKELSAGTVQLAYSLNVRSEEMDESRRYTWKVEEFLNNNIKSDLPGISVDSCSMPTIGIGVDVEQLVKRSLDVQVIDENGIPQEHLEINPPKVEMYVREDTPENLKATVKLSENLIKKAREDYVVEQPFIRIGEMGEHLRHSSRVQVKLPPTEQARTARPLNPTIGIINGQFFHGQYKIEITNESKLRTIQIQATDKAWEVYEAMPYHILIEIRDYDQPGEEILREVIYNFPQEYVKKNEIEVDKPQIAKFILTPITKE